MAENMNSPTTGPGLLLSDDLMFTSRITETARQLGLRVTVARSQAEIETLAREQSPVCVLIDLANPGLAIAELVQRLHTGSGRPFLVAYGSHVDAATLHAAREAGCDVVLPRSKFVEELPRSLAQWFRADASPNPARLQ
jgi:CheY-like chemotaxis protein